jgi:transaldolase
MKKLRSTNIRTLATAIYTVQQGFLAALNGADYMSPYVNRIDTLNNDGVGVCAEIQHLLAIFLTSAVSSNNWNIFIISFVLVFRL